MKREEENLMASSMDLKAKYLYDKCSDPIEFLNQLRQTTEPIGGGTEYSDNGELVEYEVAIIAIEKNTDAIIDRACKWWENELTYPSMTPEEIEWYKSKVDKFRKAMKEE